MTSRQAGEEGNLKDNGHLHSMISRLVQDYATRTGQLFEVNSREAQFAGILCE